MADFNQINAGQGLHVTTGWSFFCSVFPHTVPNLMAGTGNVTVECVFVVPATKVGGYFSTNADTPGATFNFYDENNSLIASESAEVPLCQWQWSGWEATGAPIKRIQVVASNQFGGFIMHDDLEASFGGGGCYADCDLSGSLDFFDFLCFQNEFAAATAYADCDGSGSHDFFDFLCFQNKFAGGCP